MEGRVLGSATQRLIVSLRQCSGELEIIRIAAIPLRKPPAVKALRSLYNKRKLMQGWTCGSKPLYRHSTDGCTMKIHLVEW